jgi:cell pole-organizing protein PopZ
MSQSARAQEPSMEEILASIRRIIADDDGAKPAAKPAAQPHPPRPATLPPRVAAPPPPRPDPSPQLNQSDIDAMLAEPDAPASNQAPPHDDILELTEAMAAPAPATSSFQTIDGQSDVIFSDVAPATEPAPYALDEARRQFSATMAPDRTLISSATSQAVDSAFNSLAQTVLVHNARTLEDLVREMLRPMLKGWLDDNLPGMVERIVRAEIERVSRGRS